MAAHSPARCPAPGTLDLAAGSFTVAGAGLTGNLAVTNTATLSTAASKTNTLTGTGTLTIGAGGSISVAAKGVQSVATAAIINAGTLAGPGTLATSGATLVMDAGAGATSLDIGNAANWSNTGTVSLAGLISLGLYNSGNGDQSSASIVNSGLFNFTTDDAGIANLYGSGAFVASLINSGTLQKTGGTGTSQVAAAITSTGTINVATGTLQLNNGGALAGTISGAGTLNLAAGSFAVAGASMSGNLAVTNAGTLSLAIGKTGTVTGAGTLSVSAGGSIALAAGSVESVAGATTFNAGALGGPGTLATSGPTAILDAGAGATSLVIGNAGIWSNSGTASIAGLIGLGLYNNGNGDQSGASIVNSGVFNFTTDDAGIANLYGGGTFTASFTNTGTLGKTAGTLTHLGIALNSTGAIAVATGILELDGNSSLTGTITGAGTLALAGSAFTIGTLTGAGLIAVNSGTLAAAGTAGSIANSLVFNDGTLSGTGSLTTSGTVTIVDIAGSRELSIGAGANWVNTGTVNDAGNVGLGLYNGGNGDGTSATITNNGLFNITGDNGGVSNAFGQTSFTASFTNSGTLVKTAGALSHMGVAVNSTGTITVSSGTLELDAASSLTGTVGGAGTLALAGNVFTIATLAGAGTIAVNSGTLALGSTPASIANGLVFNDGTLSGTGTLSTSGTTSVTDVSATRELSIGNGAAWVNTGTVNDAGIIDLGLFNGGNGDATSAGITNSGVFNLTTNDGGIGNVFGATGFVATLTNSGTLTKTGGTGTSTIQVALQSTGAIGASTGTLALNGGGTLGGTIGASKTGVVQLGTGVAFAASKLAVADNAANAALTIADGGTLTNASTLTLSGRVALLGAAQLSNAAAGTILLASADATVTGTGTAYSFANAGLMRDNFSGTASVTASIANTGTIDAAAGLLKLTTVTGAGKLAIEAGATLELGTAVATTQAIAFKGAAGAMLKQDKPASIATAIAGLGAGDRIDLAGLSVTSATVSGSTLSVVTAAKTYTYAAGASLAGLGTGIVSDGNGGSIVSLYRQAGASFTPTGLAFGNVHVGTGETLALSITNTAAPDGYSEALDVAFGSFPASLKGTGAANGIKAGASAALSVVLSTAAAAGSLASTGTFTLSSDGTGIDSRGATSLAAQTIAITGGVYRLAAPSLSTTSVDLGVVHVGDTPGQALTITNTDAADGFSELLNASASASGNVTETGAITGLAAGSASTAISFGLLTTTTGTLTGTTTLGLFSDGGTIDGLGTTTLTSQTITVTGTVDNYAIASLEDPGGPAFTAGGAPNSYVLNLGTISLGGSGASVTLGALNSATGLADLLSGSISVSGSGFTNTGFGTFSGLGAGQDEHVQSVTLSAATAGTFTETVTLTAHGSNGSGYIGGDQTSTLTITGTVAAQGGTYTLSQGPNTIVGAAGNDLFISAAGGLNSRDSLTGSTGYANTLQLTGAGVFDINAPKTFANIQTILATEGQAASGTAPDTTQTLLLRDGSSETVLVGAGTAAPGNANPETITLYDGNDTNTYVLAGGTDTLYLGAGTDTVTLGSAANIIVAGGGTALVKGTIAQAAATINGNSASTTTLEITNGGTQTLASTDSYLTVKLDAASKLTLSAQGFVTADGSNGGDTLIAGAASQTLIGGAHDVLTGYTAGGDSFLGASAALNGDTVGNWTTGDTLDLTDMNSATLKALSYAPSTGTLTVKDGTHTSAIVFAGAGIGLGNFTVLGTDGHGGTLIGWHG